MKLPSLGCVSHLRRVFDFRCKPISVPSNEEVSSNDLYRLHWKAERLLEKRGYFAIDERGSYCLSSEPLLDEEDLCTNDDLYSCIDRALTKIRERDVINLWQSKAIRVANRDATLPIDLLNRLNCPSIEEICINDLRPGNIDATVLVERHADRLKAFLWDEERLPELPRSHRLSSGRFYFAGLPVGRHYDALKLWQRLECQILTSGVPVSPAITRRLLNGCVRLSKPHFRLGKKSERRSVAVAGARQWLDADALLGGVHAVCVPVFQSRACSVSPNRVHAVP
eukprot:Polyplicarium_translucidae@DN766_c1_g1_i1.p1